jgi:hypothetical protein
MTDSDPLQFSYVTADWYWLLCDDATQEPPCFDYVGDALNFIFDARLLRDTEVLLSAMGCLDADL